MKYFLSFFILVLLYSCQSRKESKLEEIQFNVDQALLDTIPAIIEQAKVKCYLPIGFELVPDSVLDLMAADQPVGDVLVKAFKKESANATILFSRLDQYMLAHLDSVHEDPEYFFNANNQWQAIDASEFSFNDFSVRQYVLQTTELVNFRLYFMRGVEQRMEVNCVVPRKYYENEIKGIEAFLGSFSYIY